MGGGKPPRDCKQSLRPYGETYNFVVWGASTSRKNEQISQKQKFPHGVPWGGSVLFYVVEYLITKDFYDDTLVKILAFFK